MIISDIEVPEAIKSDNVSLIMDKEIMLLFLELE
jgi:hypothetical protein